MKHLMRKITVHRGQSAQSEPGVLVPLDAQVVQVALDVAGEHGSVLYYTDVEVEVDEDESADAEEA